MESQLLDTYKQIINNLNKYRYTIPSDISTWLNKLFPRIVYTMLGNKNTNRIKRFFIKIVAYLFGNYYEHNNTISLNYFDIQGWDKYMLLDQTYNPNIACAFYAFNKDYDVNKNKYCFNCSSTHNCTGCVDCINCTNCEYCWMSSECIKCTECTRCNNCENCFNNCFNLYACLHCIECKACFHCTDCVSSNDCTYSTKCTGCIYCNYCEDYCVDCKNCTKCKNCIQCDKCYMCIKCTSMKNCTNCTDCSSMKNCTNCTDCSSCEDCDHCTKCYNHCITCLYCTECKNCENCLNSVFCKSCTLSEHIQNCINCNECTYCYYCINSSNLYKCYIIFNASNHNNLNAINEYKKELHIDRLKNVFDMNNNGSRFEYKVIDNEIVYGNIYNEDGELEYTGIFNVNISDDNDDITTISIIYGSKFKNGIPIVKDGIFDENNDVLCGKIYDFNGKLINNISIVKAFKELYSK